MSVDIHLTNDFKRPLLRCRKTRRIFNKNNNQKYHSHGNKLKKATLIKESPNNKKYCFYASADSENGTTETNERLFFFLRNSTIPSVNANKV